MNRDQAGSAIPADGTATVTPAGSASSALRAVSANSTTVLAKPFAAGVLRTRRTEELFNNFKNLFFHCAYWPKSDDDDIRHSLTPLLDKLFNTIFMSYQYPDHGHADRPRATGAAHQGIRTCQIKKSIWTS